MVLAAQGVDPVLRAEKHPGVFLASGIRPFAPALLPRFSREVPVMTMATTTVTSSGVTPGDATKRPD